MGRAARSGGSSATRKRGTHIPHSFQIPLHRLLQVQQVGFGEGDASQLLEQAFGWGTQTFWRGLKKEEVPDPSQIAATLAYLRDELGERALLRHAISITPTSDAVPQAARRRLQGLLTARPLCM